MRSVFNRGFLRACFRVVIIFIYLLVVIVVILIIVIVIIVVVVKPTDTAANPTLKKRFIITSCFEPVQYLRAEVQANTLVTLIVSFVDIYILATKGQIQQILRRWLGNLRVYIDQLWCGERRLLCEVSNV